jgi:hypothetical protein
MLVMTIAARRSLPLVATVLALAAAGCSGSSSGNDGPSVALAVTDAASDELSSFVIGLESVELQRAVGGPVAILQQPLAVDFAALADLSRVLNVTAIPEDVYTGVEVVLLFDNDRVVINGETAPATLLDSDGVTPLTGTLALTFDFPAPLVATNGHAVLELDLDLDQSVDVDSGANAVVFEPSLLPRIDPVTAKEHAIGGSLRTVVLADSRFRIGLEALPGDPVPVATITVDSATVFQVDGVCLTGLAGLSALDNLPAGSWVQAFGSVGTSSSYFDAATVEAGTGSYNGGSDIVEGVITGLTGSNLAVRGHSNNSTHTVFEFNLNYTANTDLANTKVVRRGSAQLYDVNALNVGQLVRMFGVKSGNTIDLTTSTDVVRVEPTRVFGIANGAPTGGELEVDLVRVELRDAATFNWGQGGAAPADPDNFVMSVANLGTGQGIVAGTPVVATGFFTPANDAGTVDFIASSLANRNRTASLLLVRDRANGLTVTPTFGASQIDFAFAGAAAGLEKAVVDQGFAGTVDVVASGVSLVPADAVAGLGFYVLRDRTLNTVSFYLTFAGFSQGVFDALTGATLLNFSAVGVYDSAQDEVATALATAVVQ